MIYYCETCGGDGETCDGDENCATCLNCDGTGRAEICISRLKILPNWKNKPALEELQRDARRVISDCGKMLTCNPGHWRSYVAQLDNAIFEIEKSAIKLLP